MVHNFRSRKILWNFPVKVQIQHFNSIHIYVDCKTNINLCSIFQILNKRFSSPNSDFKMYFNKGSFPCLKYIQDSIFLLIFQNFYFVSFRISRALLYQIICACVYLINIAFVRNLRLLQNFSTMKEIFKKTFSVH